MSSNPNHITPVLTLDNYEEYFLLYVDEELHPEGKKAVEDFVRQHPHLQEELDLLCSTKLPADDLVFENKTDLFADSMKVTATDESLLLYIDNELPAWEAKIVEAQLERDAAFAAQYQLLLNTKVDQNEAIPYPNKKELYRHTDRRIAPVWLRVAAAVVLVAGAGTLAWLGINNANPVDSNVAIVTPTPKVETAPPVTKQAQNPIPTEVAKTTVANKKEAAPKATAKKENLVAVYKPAPAKKEVKIVTQPSFSKPHVAENVLAKSNHLPVAKEDAVVVGVPVAKKVTPTDINKPVVTSETPDAYVTIEAPAKTTVPVQSVASTTGENGGGSLKGFLRKATRIIERRTGIKAVNDDNELLIGAVALKL